MSVLLKPAFIGLVRLNVKPVKLRKDISYHAKYHGIAFKNGMGRHAGSPYKSMQVAFYQRVTGIGITNKNLQVNAS